MSDEVGTGTSNYEDEFNNVLTEIQKRNLRYAKYAFILAVMNYIIALFSPQIILLGDALVNIDLIDIYALAPSYGRRLMFFESLSILFTTLNIYIYHFNKRLQYQKIRLNSTIAIGSASIAAIEILKFSTLSSNLSSKKGIPACDIIIIAWMEIILSPSDLCSTYIVSPIIFIQLYSVQLFNF